MKIDPLRSRKIPFFFVSANFWPISGKKKKKKFRNGPNIQIWIIFGNFGQLFDFSATDGYFFLFYCIRKVVGAPPGGLRPPGPPAPSGGLEFFY